MFKVRLSSHYINCKRDGHLNNRRWHVNAGWLFCPLYLLKSRNLLMTFLQENSLSTAKGGIWIKYCLQYKKKNGLLERENEAFGPLAVSTICGYSNTVLSIHLLSTVTEIPILNCTCSIISPLFAEWGKKKNRKRLISLAAYGECCCFINLEPETKRNQWRARALFWLRTLNHNKKKAPDQVVKLGFVMWRQKYCHKSVNAKEEATMREARCDSSTSVNDKLFTAALLSADVFKSQRRKGVNRLYRM